MVGPGGLDRAGATAKANKPAPKANPVLGGLFETAAERAEAGGRARPAASVPQQVGHAVLVRVVAVAGEHGQPLGGAGEGDVEHPQSGR